MTLQLLVNGTDYTAKWRLYESRWTMQAWQGQSAQSEFILDAANGEITHTDMAARKIVEVWEDASGSPKCLYRGRIATKALGQGPFQAPGHAMRWALQCEDYNVELSGIRVINATRPEETDDERVEVIRAAYLAGSGSTHPQARDSTDLGNTYIGNTPADERGMPAETYTDTAPGQVLNAIADFTGRVFFVYLNDDGTGELAYMSRDEMALLADISIVDDAEDEDADGVDVYAAYKGEQAGDHDGMNVLTGGAVRYGDGSYFEESDVSGFEAIYDKWETTVHNEFIYSETAADFYVNTMVAGSDESNTYFAAIDMTPDNVHRIKAGMMVPLIRKRANKGGDAAARATLVTYNPVKPNADGETLYRVELQLGRPQFVRGGPRNRLHFPPRPPSPGTPGTGSLRLYISDVPDTPGLGAGDEAAGWETRASTFNYWNMYDTPHNTGHGTVSWDAVNAAVKDVAITGGVFPLTTGSVVLDVVQNGGTIKGQVPMKSRSGVGINESLQDNVAAVDMRVYRPSGGGSIVGTCLGVTTVGSLKFSTSEHVNRTFAETAFAGVAGAANGDYLLITIGTHHIGPTSGGTGASLQKIDDAATDLPVDQVTTTNLNAWFELTGAGGTPAETPGSTVLPGDEDFGEAGCYAPCGHTHAAGLLSSDGEHFFDASGIEYDGTTSGLTANDVQDAIDQLAAGAASGEVIDHGAMGTTEDFDASAGADHEGTLDDDLTVTLSGATNDEAAWMTLILTQDGSGGNDITWPGSVVWPGGVAPVIDQTADAVTIVSLVSYDGGTNWFGAFPGAGATPDSGGGLPLTAQIDGEGFIVFDENFNAIGTA